MDPHANIEIGPALTEEDRQAVFRFRYDIYVEEMGRYKTTADHKNRTLMEEEDATARIFCAKLDGRVVGTGRLSWGGDAPFSKRLVHHYALQPFIDRVPPEAMAVAERGMVAPELRGTNIFMQMMGASRAFIKEKRIQLVFGACEPHLLSLYVSLGQRTYSKTNINSPEAGYLIPLVSVIEDYEYYRNLAVPNLDEIVDYGDDARIPDCVEELIASDSAVTSRHLTPAPSYWEEILEALPEIGGQKFSALDGLTDEEADRCLGKSNIIECANGDRVLKRGGVARNLFVVLSGVLEVRDEGAVLAVIGPGEVFGEMAFLLGIPRTKDVYAASDDVRVLSLSETTLQRMIKEDTQIAANLMLNISKMLCLRLIRMS